MFTSGSFCFPRIAALCYPRKATFSSRSCWCLSCCVLSRSLRVFLPVGGCFYTPEKNLPFSFYIAQLAQLGPGCVLCGHKKRYVAILGLARWLMAADGARSMGVCPMTHKFSDPWRTRPSSRPWHMLGCCLPPTSAFMPSGSHSTLPSWFEHLHR